MPQTYIRTSPGVIGLNGSLRPVIELWTCSMPGLECLESVGRRAARRLAQTGDHELRSHQLDQRRELGPVRAAGQRGPKRTIERGATAPRHAGNGAGPGGEVRVRRERSCGLRKELR